MRKGGAELNFLLGHDAMWASGHGNGNIEIGFDACILEPEGAPPFDSLSRGFFLCREGFEQLCLTRLDDGWLQFALERARDLIRQHRGLSAHQRLEIAEAFDAAIGASPSSAVATADIAAGTPDHRQLASDLAPELAALDAALHGYLALVGRSFLEGPIAALGLQGELADGLLVGNAVTPCGARKAILIEDPHRRPGRYRSAIGMANVLELYGQRVSPFRFGAHDTVDWRMTQLLHAAVFKDVLDRPGEIRQTRLPIRRQGRKELLTEGLAPDLIENAMVRWNEDFHVDHWRDPRWFIRIGLAHIAFEKIHPFSDGNGRIGRLLMHLQMAEMGKPLLPLEAAIRRSRQDYLMALDGAIASGDVMRFLRYLIGACLDAIRIGQALFEELRPIQLELAAAIRETGVATRRPVLLAAQLLVPLILGHRDFGYIFDSSTDVAAHLLQQRGSLEMIDIDGMPAWIVPGIQEAVQKAFA
ncbi:MAG TPA: Fic family protein [Dongiaceae bacterium]|nr:Fic family protein [Dongiaceae bacterium]